MSWIFFDTATPKIGVQLSHEIESITCEDKTIKVYFKEDGFQQSLGIVELPSRARKLPILVSFPSKEDADAAFVGMAEQMTQQSGNWFVSPAPEPFERDATHDAKITYPFTDATGNKFRLEQDGKGNLVFRYEDGTATTCPLSIFPEALGE